MYLWPLHRPGVGMTEGFFHTHCFCKAVYVDGGFQQSICHQECCMCGQRKVVDGQKPPTPEVKDEY